MKPNYTSRVIATLPKLLLLPALAGLASGAIIAPDGFGNVLVTTDDSGTDTILVAAAQPLGFHEIRFDPNTTLGPGGAAVVDIRVVNGSGATYTVNAGAGSSILGGTFDGITTANTVGTAGALAINANGNIIRGANGVSGTLGTITLVNNSAIFGTTLDGIRTTGVLNLTNNYSQNPDLARTITGQLDGVDAGNNSTIGNFGNITGTTVDGVVVGTTSSVTNFTTTDADSPFGQLAGGRIIGGRHGISGGNTLTVLNEALGLIQGTNGNGVLAGNALNLENFSDITGNLDGVLAGTTAIINNRVVANITGGVDGIEALAGAVITNQGTLTGGSGFGINILGAGSTVNNTGTVNGGTLGAINGFTGADIFNFGLGSRVFGNVNTAAGVDSVNFTDGLTTPGGTSNFIVGNVTGVETISKTGTGVALIGRPGDGLFNVASNLIDITGGGLYINGAINAVDGVSQSTINAGGAAVGGTGAWNANLNVLAGGFSAGAIPINLDVNPANALGTVTITGDVDHSPGSFIRFDVAPQGGGADLIDQNGAGNTYDVTGANLRISATDNDSVISNGTYTVVDSDQVITGVGTGSVQMQFNSNVNNNDSSVQGSEIYDASPVTTAVLTNFFTTVGTADGGTNLVLIVNHDFSSLPGLGANEVALGAALDASIDTGNSITQDFIAALDYSDLGSVQSTLASIIPDNVLTSASALVSGNYRLHRVVEDHLAMARTDGVMVQTRATYDSQGNLLDGGGAIGSGGGRGNLWGTASHDWKESNYGSADIDGEDSSFTAGVDYAVSGDFLIGLVLDGSQSDYDYTGGGSEIDSFRIALYGTYGQATGFYSNFLLGYGQHDLDLSRALGGVLAGTSYGADTEADGLQAMATIGYNTHYGCWKVGPFLGLEYQGMDVDSFSPDGVGGAIGGVGSFDVDSLRALVGFRGETTMGQFSPYVAAAYAHEFEDDTLSATGTIPGGATFGFSGGGLDSAVLISAGTGYTLTEDLGLSIGYHGELSTGDGVDSHGASVGLNWAY